MFGADVRLAVLCIRDYKLLEPRGNLQLTQYRETEKPASRNRG